MPLNPLEALQTLMGGPGVSNAASNPAVELAGLRDDRLGEMKRNLSKRGGGFSTGATPFDVADLESDIANDPTTGEVEQNRIAGINRANTAAQMQGYGSAPEAAGAGRQIELAKSRIPVEVAEKSGQTQRDVANIQGQNSVRTKREEEQGLTRRSHDSLAQLLKTPLGENDTLSIPGGGSIKHGATPFPTGPAGVGLEQQIQKRMKMETPPGPFDAFGNMLSGGRAGFGISTPEEKAAAERALDVQFPSWRQRMDPGFKFAVPGGTGAQPQATPAGAAPATVPQAATPGGLVQMTAPDGRILHVPADKVAELEALGARR